MPNATDLIESQVRELSARLKPTQALKFDETPIALASWSRYEGVVNREEQCDSRSLSRVKFARCEQKFGSPVVFMKSLGA